MGSDSSLPRMGLLWDLYSDMHLSRFANHPCQPFGQWTSLSLRPASSATLSNILHCLNWAGDFFTRMRRPMPFNADTHPVKKWSTSSSPRSRPWMASHVITHLEMAFMSMLICTFLQMSSTTDRWHSDTQSLGPTLLYL